MVEFALILPLMLVLILGVFQVGLALLIRLELTHAAQMGAAAGASDPQACVTAESSAAEVYGSVPDESECGVTGTLLELRLSDAAPMVAPFGPWTVRVTSRAVIQTTAEAVP